MINFSKIELKVQYMNHIYYFGSTMKIDVDEFRKTLEEIYDLISNINDGKVADYIPQLAGVNPDLFGISVCTVDGHIINIGDVKEEFTLQSCSKVLTYLKACEETSPDNVHKHVGHEPSGRAFNEFCFNDDGLPYNPMINSGAIMIISLIESTKPQYVRYDEIKKFFKRLSGNMGIFNFDNGVYLSERDNADTNRALTYIMNGNNVFPSNTNLETTLDLYFQTCSVATNTETIAIMASTIANNGVCPINNEKVISPILVQNCLTLMSTCGMYDFSGKWAFEVGIPAKSGVSGCIMLVIPGVAGICVWSPPLDKKGNSVKGIAFGQELVKRYPKFHTHYRTQSVKTNGVHLSSLDDEMLVQAMIDAAAKGNLDKITQILSTGKVSLNDSDYDNRSALHLAVAEGHMEIVQYLVGNGADIEIKDRSGTTPIYEAQSKLIEGQRSIYDDIYEYLNKELELIQIVE